MKRKTSFTMIELLVIVAIVGVLMTISLPSLSKARGKALGTVCGGNLGSINKGFQIYINDNNGLLPPIGLPAGSELSWQKQVAEILNGKGLKASENNIATTMSVFACPEDKDFEYNNGSWEISYGINRHLTSIFNDPSRQLFISEIDYPTEKVLFADSTDAQLFVGSQEAITREITQRHLNKSKICWLDGHIFTQYVPLLRHPKNFTADGN
ncbi:MAG: type II secretion system protein [Lentisphaeraceae bacterium]|nr:type II secretion system protein [Lentisphaeraceae bacterium]